MFRLFDSTTNDYAPKDSHLDDNTVFVIDSYWEYTTAEIAMYELHKHDDILISRCIKNGFTPENAKNWVSNYLTRFIVIEIEK